MFDANLPSSDVGTVVVVVVVVVGVGTVVSIFGKTISCVRNKE